MKPRTVLLGRSRNALFVWTRMWRLDCWQLRTYQLRWQVIQIGPIIFAVYEPQWHSSWVGAHRYAVREFGLEDTEL